MKHYLSLILMVIITIPVLAKDKTEEDMEVYMLTVVPGEEIYSIYGHSALRVVIKSVGYDQVFNWGVFDFTTPNFGYRFAKGRLDYLLSAYSYKRFLQEYLYENRSVYSQKVYLETEEYDALMSLLQENLKPENRSYRYDFFYDNCATRIRDILYEAINGEIVIMEETKEEMPTFRNLLNIYQRDNLWLDLGIDLLLGMPADKKADKNDQMFLPDYLMYNLTDAAVVRESGESPLLGEAIKVLEIPGEGVGKSVLISPGFILWLLFAVILILSLRCKKSNILRKADITIFSLYSALVIVVYFMTFFTDHGATRENLNAIWCSPLLMVVLFMIIVNSKKLFVYRLTLSIILAFLIAAPALPQGFNKYMPPVLLIPAIRLLSLSSFTTGLFKMNNRCCF